MAAAPARFNKGNCVIPANLAFRSQTPIEVDEVGAATKQDMLAVIDDLPRSGVNVGGGTPANVASTLH
jgi:hypothetical protein